MLSSKSLVSSRAMARRRAQSLSHHLSVWWPTLRLMGRESVSLMLLVVTQAAIVIGLGLATATL